jgi:hypothetical protein
VALVARNRISDRRSLARGHEGKTKVVCSFGLGTEASESIRYTKDTHCVGDYSKGISPAISRHCQDGSWLTSNFLCNHGTVKLMLPFCLKQWSEFHVPMLAYL